MGTITLQNIRQSEGLMEALVPLKSKLEEKLNLKEYKAENKPISISNNLLQRLTLSAGLSLSNKRTLGEVEKIAISKTGLRIHETTFSRFDLQDTWSALLKLRYNHLDIDWSSASLKSRIINYEMLQGLSFLLENDNLDNWLNVSASSLTKSHSTIPFLNLTIGSYEDDIPANLNLNGRNIPNTQILIAGATGSGKSNLLAVLMSEIRGLTVESAYPVNFLFFATQPIATGSPFLKLTKIQS